MKKLLAIVLMLAMVVSFAACGGNESSKNFESASGTTAGDLPAENLAVKEVTPEELATETAEDAMTAFCEMNLEEMMQLFDTNESVESLPFRNKYDLYDEFMETLAGESGFDGMESEVEPLAKAVIDAFLGKMSYEIKDVAELDGSFSFKIDFSSINFDNLPDFEEALSSPEVEAGVEDLALKLFEEGKVTEDMSEPEMLKVMMPELMAMVEDVIVGSIEDMNIVSAEGTLVVYEKDGKWVVDSEESNFDEILKSMGSF